MLLMLDALLAVLVRAALVVLCAVAVVWGVVLPIKMGGQVGVVSGLGVAVIEVVVLAVGFVFAVRGTRTQQHVAQQRVTEQPSMCRIVVDLTAPGGLRETTPTPPREGEGAL